MFICIKAIKYLLVYFRLEAQSRIIVSPICGCWDSIGEALRAHGPAGSDKFGKCCYL